jgi:methyl-accepting chemotaxis protein
MSAMPSPAQSEFYAGLLSVESSVKAPAIRPTALENDPSPITQQSLRKRASRVLARFLITFCIGVAAALAWQSYGDAARQIIASSYPQLGWLAPHAEPVAQDAPDMIAVAARAANSLDQQKFDALSLDLDAVRQSIDRIATSIAAGQEQMTRSIDGIAARLQQMTRSFDQLAADQEQMTREITKLQAVEQYVLYKNSEPSPRPALAPARNPVPRPSQAPMVR